jgi:hypothetical protein
VRMAVLRLAGMPPGARVFADGNPLGEVEGDGTFSYNLQPGDHTLELHKDPARSKPLQRHFNAGESVQLGPADLALQTPNATVNFKVSPPTARVTIRLESEPESQARVLSQGSISLPDGSYVISATAPKYTTYITTVPVAGGAAAKTIEIVLKPIEESKPTPSPQTFGMGDWDDAGGWVKEGHNYVHKGGNFVTFKPAPVNGSIMFTIMLQKGKRLQWVVNYKDEKNYALFQVDKKNFYRIQVVNGRKTELAKTPHGQQEKAEYFTIRVDVSPDAIEHYIRRGNQWAPLDSRKTPGAQFSNGKFGFYIPGKDEYAVNFFVYTPG